MENNFQWGRLDEIIMFVLAIGFIIILANLNMPAASIMTMAGSLVSIVPIYIKTALDRSKANNGNGNGNGNGKSSTPITEISPNISPNISQPIEVKKQKTENDSKHFLRVE